MVRPTHLILGIFIFGLCTSISGQSMEPKNKGELHLQLSLPHINSFFLQPQNESNAKVNTGFWGISAGVVYYHSQNQFIHFSASAVIDLFIPVPAAVDYSGEVELMSSTYLSLSNNHKIKRFTIGYGVSYGRNIWDLRYYDDFDPPPPTRPPVMKDSKSLGIIIPCYYTLGEHFSIGIIYRPTFFRVDAKPTIAYEHLISIDMAMKIRLKK